MNCLLWIKFRRNMNHSNSSYGIFTYLQWVKYFWILFSSFPTNEPFQKNLDYYDFKIDRKSIVIKQNLWLTYCFGNIHTWWFNAFEMYSNNITCCWLSSNIKNQIFFFSSCTIVSPLLKKGVFKFLPDISLLRFLNPILISSSHLLIGILTHIYFLMVSIFIL